MPFISIQLNSNRPGQLVEFFDNMEATADRPEDIEVLLHIDAGDTRMEELVAREKERRRFALHVLQTDLVTDYSTLWKPLNPLFKMTHPDAYFVANLFDEVHFATKGWDSILRRYEGYYPDHIFRLRCSKYRYRNYTDFWECGFAPDSLAFYTRRWLELNGDWNPCLGPDSFQQCVAFYLFTSNNKSPWKQYYRDIPVPELRFKGEGAGIGLEGEARYNRLAINTRAWFILMSHPMQQEANRRAMRMKAHMIAFEHGGEEKVVVEEKPYLRLFLVKRRQPAETIAVISYRLSWAKTTLLSWLRVPYMLYYSGGGEALRTAMAASVFLVVSSHSPYGVKMLKRVGTLVKALKKVKHGLKVLAGRIYRRVKHIALSIAYAGYRGAKHVKYIIFSTVCATCQGAKHVQHVLFSTACAGYLRVKHTLQKLLPQPEMANDGIWPVSWSAEAFLNRVSGGEGVFISVWVAGEHLMNVIGFVDSVEEMAAFPERIEVVVQTGEASLREKIEEYAQARRITLRCASPDEIPGFSSDSAVYYIARLSDTVRFETQGWDRELERYAGYYPDHIFRLRCSGQRFRNYTTMAECISMPDTITFYTRKWLALQEFRKPPLDHDAFQQCVAFYLFTSDPYCHTQYYRDLALPHVHFSGEPVGKAIHSKHYALPRKIRLAAKRCALLLKAYILAEEMLAQQAYPRLVILEQGMSKTFRLLTENGEVINILPYAVTDFKAWLIKSTLNWRTQMK